MRRVGEHISPSTTLSRHERQLLMVGLLHDLLDPTPHSQLMVELKNERADLLQQKYCKACGTTIEPDAQFCGYCGARVSFIVDNPEIRTCPSCGKRAERPTRFCQNCGYQWLPISPRMIPNEDGRSGPLRGMEVEPPERSLATLEKVGFGMVALAIAELFGIVFVNLLALVPAFIISLELSNPSFEFSLYLPIEIPLFTIEGIWFLLYFFGIILAIMGSFIWLFLKDGRQWIRIVRYPFQTRGELVNTATNSLTLIGQLFFALLFFNLLYVLGVWVAGSEASTPNLEGGNFRGLLFLLANAAVYEELVVRVLLLGLPLLLVKSWQQRKLTRWVLQSQCNG